MESTPLASGLVLPWWLRNPERKDRVRLKPPITHVYRDVDGIEVFRRIRWRYSDGSKQVSYARPPRSRRDLNHPKLGYDMLIPEKPTDAGEYLYRLPELFSAILYGTPQVYWAEGETDADAIAGTGAVVTTHHGGAGKATKQQAAWFEGFEGEVYLCVDRDIPGAYDAARRWDLLQALGLDGERLILVEAREGKDVRDHLEAGHPLETLPRIGIDGVRERAALHSEEVGRAIGYFDWNPNWTPEVAVEGAADAEAVSIEEELRNAGVGMGSARRLAMKLGRKSWAE